MTTMHLGIEVNPSFSFALLLLVVGSLSSTDRSQLVGELVQLVLGGLSEGIHGPALLEAGQTQSLVACLCCAP